jgi:hypothetical protein
LRVPANRVHTEINLENIHVDKNKQNSLLRLRSLGLLSGLSGLSGLSVVSVLGGLSIGGGLGLGGGGVGGPANEVNVDVNLEKSNVDRLERT